mmetsp:Transcript_13766/g.19098  ORF Transcript_13766/g.19098 Transcript_13766/m.19098 type:complete len:194 (+) Transcript_13766:30-611(+)
MDAIVCAGAMRTPLKRTVLRWNLKSVFLAACAIFALVSVASSSSRVGDRQHPLRRGIKTAPATRVRGSTLSRRNIGRAITSCVVTMPFLARADEEAMASSSLATFSNGAASPVACVQAKEGMKKRRGIIDVSDTAVFERTQCKIGGYVTKTPYSLQAPDYFKPLTGYFNGGPDPAGLLDMRLESQDFGGSPYT